MPFTIDRVDARILEVLQVEGRLPNVTLADRVGLSPSACLRRTRALEEAGVIAGYRAALDRPALGLGLTAFVALRVEQHSEATSRAIEAALCAIPEVVACHVISGDADFLVEVATTGLEGYEKVLLGRILAIDRVTDARTSFAIRTALSRGPLPVTPSA